MEQNPRQNQTVTHKPVSANQRSSNHLKESKLPINSTDINNDPIESIDQYSRSSTLLLDDKEPKLQSITNKKRLNIKIGQTSDKFFVSNKTDPNENFHQRSYDRRIFNNNTNDITEIIKSDVKNLTDCFHQNRSNRLSNRKLLTAPHLTELTSQRKSSEKKVACHLYDHLPKITDRNDSSNSDSLTASSNSTNLNLKLNKFGISRKSKLSKQRFLNVMDRSVDSIGSCSLDVDAESTFSGTCILWSWMLCSSLIIFIIFFFLNLIYGEYYDFSHLLTSYKYIPFIITFYYLAICTVYVKVLYFVLYFVHYTLFGHAVNLVYSSRRDTIVTCNRKTQTQEQRYYGNSNISRI